jgi:uncharacterized cupin superfamily protein
VNVFNLRDGDLFEHDDLPEGHRFLMRSVGQDVGSVLTGLTVYELPPGHRHWPYHFELVEEEWALVVAGEVTVRTPSGDLLLRAGEVICFLPGPAGAHAIRNDGDVPARVAMPSTRAPRGDAVVYPDSGKVKVKCGDFSRMLRLGEDLGYWEGES